MKLLCNRCKKEVKAILIPKVINLDKNLLRNPEDVRSPKNTVMIKAICSECDRYIKFVAQTPEIVDEVNETIEAILRGIVKDYLDKLYK